MQKALETVKRKEDRKPFTPRDKNNFRNDRYKRPQFHREVERNNSKPISKPIRKEETVVVKEKQEEKVQENHIDLSKLTVAELREMAKNKDIKGYSTLKKAELIDVLK
ncbi:MAG: Rho termination factor N-terminal domain-containing protein [Bacilli bacterium]|nr:Rho termination factor N-terminal domain-containing protein [Bacilli bacterium]